MADDLAWKRVLEWGRFGAIIGGILGFLGLILNGSPEATWAGFLPAYWTWLDTAGWMVVLWNALALTAVFAGVSFLWYWQVFNKRSINDMLKCAAPAWQVMIILFFLGVLLPVITMVYPPFVSPLPAEYMPALLWSSTLAILSSLVYAGLNWGLPARA